MSEFIIGHLVIKNNLKPESDINKGIAGSEEKCR